MAVGQDWGRRAQRRQVSAPKGRRRDGWRREVGRGAYVKGGRQGTVVLSHFIFFQLS